LAGKKASRPKKPGAKAKRPKSRKSRPSQRETASGAIEQRIVKALAHPMRVQILTILNDRMASPNELSKELEESLSQVSYHVKVLNDFECIEMVKTKPIRGAIEHFYRATSKVFVPSWIAKTWPKSIRDTVAGTILEEIQVDLDESIRTGLFNDRPNHVVGRDPRTLDNTGRQDAEALAAEFFERFEDIAIESDKRLANGEGDLEVIQSSAVLLIFTSLKGKKLKTGRKP
jgi:DNA-binding transcriptional ArsR family regulator